jgi:hypothetical protein
MAGRKRHSSADIVRKLRRADELAAEGKIGENIATDLQVSPAPLYDWPVRPVVTYRIADPDRSRHRNGGLAAFVH